MKKRQSFQNRFLALFLVSIVLPIIIMATILAFYFQKRIYRDNEKYFSTSLYSISTNLSTYVSDLKRLALTPYIYDDILNFFAAVENGKYTKNGSFDYRIELHRQNYTTSIQRILNTAREDILAVSFMPVNPDNHIIVTATKTSDLINTTDYPYQKEPWYQEALNTAEPYHFMVSEAPPYIRTETTVISALHLVRNVYTKRKLGVIRIDASDKIIKDIFSSVTLSENSGFVIAGQDGTPVYQVGKVEEGVLKKLSSAENMIRTDSDTYRLYKSDISGMPWQLIFVSSQKDIFKEVSIVWSLAAVLSLSSILAAFSIFRSNSKKTALALNSILNTMKKVAKGDLEASVPDTDLLQNDSFNTEELSLIAENLNEMIQKLQLYIDQSYKYEIDRQEAEYRALQSQVNPHFLYNTLNCFLSMNRIGMKKELEDSIIQLTRIFRYTCSNAKLTTVQEEFEFCIQYCNLLKIRYDERLTFLSSMEEDAKNISIPRLLIQPLVENALKHGMEGDGISITISISASIEDDTLILKVKNNGIPIDIQEVYSDGKVGIRNVENRIKIFHPQASFEIKLTGDITSMTIKIPLEGGTTE
ncbi:two-component system, sensor histidine kinase YesM [Lacrimispora sphenoides]|uniref:cache domain-containing sensor histidine kinase n=1 Tax=Lacrimispora sphenoides TaxID=29370 RepID=UPI0008B07EE7|nr:sensor histidine kinase [Lacrimispora sphenoides]SET78909.1 two-component system, sensor histidine kinase YesM [Lacrimispora sphenoides]